jgi:hypothetical protein
MTCRKKGRIRLRAQIDRIEDKSITRIGKEVATTSWQDENNERLSRLCETPTTAHAFTSRKPSSSSYPITVGYGTFCSAHSSSYCSVTDAVTHAVVRGQSNVPQRPMTVMTAFRLVASAEARCRTRATDVTTVENAQTCIRIFAVY